MNYLKLLIIMQGAPGSGKSTLANTIQHCRGKFTHVICSADQYMVKFSEPDGKFVYNFNPSRLKECHENCRQDAHNFMKKGVQTIIIDNTNTTQSECQFYIDKAREYGYAVQVIRCTGNFGNIHGVPEDKVLKMKNRLEDINLE